MATDGLDEPAKPQAYIPVSQAGMPRSTFVIRTSGDPRSMAATVRKAIEDVDPALPLYGVTTLDDVVVQSLGQRRFRMLLLAIFAGMAIVLATLGLYGLIAFSVSRQTREIGIRMALGARQTTIVGHIVRQGFLRVLIGLALGLLGTVVMSKLVASQVFGVSVTDPANYAGSVLLLFVVALAGSIAPALRAARVSPVAAVRVE